MKSWKVVLFAFLLLLTSAVVLGWLWLTQRTVGAYFDSAGVRLHYTDEGSGPPVILLHGFAVNADLNWRTPGITEKLRQDFRVISLDLRGHGLSGKPHDPNRYGLEMLRDVLRLMDHLQLERAHVVGYSLGGVIALRLATLYPERLLSLSLLGAGWEAPENSAFMKAVPKLVASLQAGKGITPLSGQLGEGRAKPGWLHTWSVKLLTRYFNDQQALAAVILGIGELTFPESELANLTLPVCAIVGDRDPMRAGVEALAQRVPSVRFTLVEDADHIALARRQETVQVLRDFLRNATSAVK